jgi:hypothetical protein
MSKSLNTHELCNKLEIIDAALSSIIKSLTETVNRLEKAQKDHDISCPYCAANLKVSLTSRGAFILTDAGN